MSDATLRVSVPYEVLIHQGLSPTDKLIYCIVAAFAGSDKTCSPAQKEIAETVGYSVQTVIRALNNLRKHGLIDWETTENIYGGQGPNVYSLLGDERG